MVVDGTGQAKIVDETGREVSASYSKRFTDKLRQHDINDVIYDPRAPFIGRNASEQNIVQKIVQQLQLEDEAE